MMPQDLARQSFANGTTCLHLSLLLKPQLFHLAELGRKSALVYVSKYTGVDEAFAPLHARCVPLSSITSQGLQVSEGLGVQ